MTETFYMNAKNKQGAIDLLNRKDPTKVWRLQISEQDARSLKQNKYIHAILGEISKQSKHLNQVLDIDSWKRLCVKQYCDDCIEQNVPRLSDYWRNNSVKLMPSIDGRSLVSLGTNTRDMPKYVAAGFITWLQAYCASNGIDVRDNYQFDE